MQKSTRSPQSSTAPSVWVSRFLPLIKPGGLVLDLAAGSGRHVRLLRDCGFAVCAVDHDTTALFAFAGPCCEVRRIDLETDDPRQLGGDYDGIIVTNYLHRPLLPAIARALAPGGVLIYETFARGNERFGRPRDPDFLLRPSELLEAFTTLTVVAFEQGEVSRACAEITPYHPIVCVSRTAKTGRDRAHREDRIWSQTDQLFGKCTELFRIKSAPSNSICRLLPFSLSVLSTTPSPLQSRQVFNMTEFFQTTTERI